MHLSIALKHGEIDDRCVLDGDDLGLVGGSVGEPQPEPVRAFGRARRPGRGRGLGAAPVTRETVASGGGRPLGGITCDLAAVGEGRSNKGSRGVACEGGRESTREVFRGQRRCLNRRWRRACRWSSSLHGDEGASSDSRGRLYTGS